MKNKKYDFSFGGETEFVFEEEPESMAASAKEYLADCDEYYGWFQTQYERADGAVLQLKDVFARFKCSDYYQDLSKAARRAFTYKKLVEEARVNPNLRMHYRDDYRRTVDGKQERYRNTLLGWAPRVHNEDE